VPSMLPENENGVVIIDEIGKMECLSDLFKQTLTKILDSKHIVVGSIALKGDAFIESIKKRPDARLIPVTEKNRNRLVDDFFGILTSSVRQ